MCAQATDHGVSQEYWSGLPFPSLGIFLTQGLNQCLLNILYWQADSLFLCHLESPEELYIIPKTISWFYTVNFSSQCDTLLCQRDCVCVCVCVCVYTSHYTTLNNTSNLVAIIC